MAAPDPAAVERKMYVDMHLNGVDDPTKSIAELKYMGGGGVNAFRSAIAANAGSTAGPDVSNNLNVISTPYDLDDNAALGVTVGFLVTTSTTIEGIPVDAGVWTFVKQSTGWVPYKATPADITPPTPIATITISALTSTSAHVDWTPSSDPESAFVYYWRYYLTAAPGGVYVTTTSTSVDITGLSGNKSYTVEVYAESKGGATAHKTQAFTTAMPSGAYHVAVLADAPTHLWRFSETSGTTVADLGSVPNNLTVTDWALGAGAGIGDGAVSPVSTLSPATTVTANSAAGMASPIAGATVFAIEALIAWNTPASDVYQQSIINGNNGWFKVYLQNVPPNGPRPLYFEWTDTGGNPRSIQSPALILKNTPTHIVAMRSGTTHRILINGVEVATATTVATAAADPGTGVNSLAFRCTGRIAGIATYKTTIPSDARFLAHAQAAGVA